MRGLLFPAETRRRRETRSEFQSVFSAFSRRLCVSAGETTLLRGSHAE
jgi:hypothetical protein